MTNQFRIWIGDTPLASAPTILLPTESTGADVLEACEILGLRIVRIWEGEKGERYVKVYPQEEGN